MTDRELLDRKGHEVNDDLPPLPEPEFSSWHGEDCKTLLNPTGVCNAFPWPPRVPEKPYWVDNGYHGEPLFTADQMRAYARAAVLAERERWEERLEDADNRYHLLASELVYEGTSVQHWRSKAKAYGDAIMQIWDVLREAGYPPGQGKKVVEVVADAIRKGTP